MDEQSVTGVKIVECGETEKKKRQNAEEAFR